MSVDLNVYCHGDGLAPVADVRELLAVAGWEIRVVDNAERMEPLHETMLGSGLVLGWEADADYAKAAEAAVINRDSRAIDRLFKKNQLAAVAVDLDPNFSADPEELAELKKAGIEPKHIRSMKAARLAYSVRTSASRNESSLELQELVWNAISVAAYGLAHDPENDSFEDNARDVLEGSRGVARPHPNLKPQPSLKRDRLRQAVIVNLLALLVAGVFAGWAHLLVTKASPLKADALKAAVENAASTEDLRVTARKLIDIVVLADRRATKWRRTVRSAWLTAVALLATNLVFVALARSSADSDR